MAPLDEFVRPFYLLFLHANFVWQTPPPGQERFIRQVREARDRVDGDTLDRLLRCGAWREMLSAAWFIGLRRLDRYTDRLGELLLQSPTCFAGQGFCFALARFGSARAAEYLEKYLQTYLPAGDREYDQEWAIGALACLDGQRGTHLARPFRTRPELWDITIRGKVVGSLQPEEGVANFAAVMAFCEARFDKDPTFPSPPAGAG